MNSAAILVAAFPALLLVGVLFAPLLARRNRLRRLPQGPLYRGDDPGHSPLRDQGMPNSLTQSGPANDGTADDQAGIGDQYFTDWAALQARFNDQAAEEARASKDLITVNS